MDEGRREEEKRREEQRTGEEKRTQEEIDASAFFLLSSSFDISAALECLLFVAGEPVTTADLARALDKDEIDTEA